MYEELVAMLRKKYDKAPMVMEAADAIEKMNKNIRPKGNWTIDSKCSVCGQEPLTDFDVTLMSFCPYCGAIMEV